MAESDSQRRASARYKKQSTHQLSMRFFPADEELWRRLCSMPEGKAAYIRRLIREDMERSSEHRIEVP